MSAGVLLLVPVCEVLYFKADQKYVAARTLEKTYLLDESLAQLESEFASQFLRLHRSVLVARSALIGMEKAANDEAEAYGWALLKGDRRKITSQSTPLERCARITSGALRGSTHPIARKTIS